jgi:hypothetical protein
MEEKHWQFDGLGALLAALGGILLLMFAPVIFFAIKGDKIGVAISITMIAMLLLGLLVMCAVAVGAAYTRSTMRDGAGIALSAQDFNDRWDAAKMNNTTKLFIEGARAGRSLQQPEISPLPMPSQGLDWLPSVTVFQDEEEDWRGR